MLYAKYRPKLFSELVGQETIVQILRNAISNENISHSYLFTGPRGTGKTTTARLVAKALNCLQPTSTGDPCGECANCVAVDKGAFLDLIEVDAASNRGIDQIRELKERVSFNPSVGDYKVYIIDEVHMLTTEAFNALLKTLEEPPQHTIFILATTEPHKVPATILSRCQRHDFKLGSGETVAQRITEVVTQEGLSIDQDALQLISQHSGGSYRDSLSLLEGVINNMPKDEKKITVETVRQALGLGENTLVEEFINQLVSGNGQAALEIINQVNQQGTNLSLFIKELILNIREKLLHNIQENTSPASLMQLVGWLLEADWQQKDAVTPTLPLELVVAKYISQYGYTEPAKKPVKTVAEAKSDPEVTAEVSSPTASQKDDKKKQSPPKVSPQKKNKPKTKHRGSISCSQIQKEWSAFVTKLRTLNGHLYAFISRGNLQEVSDEADSPTAVLKVPYAFHKDRIETPSSQALLQQVAQELWQMPIQIRCEVSTEEKSQATPAAPVVRAPAQNDENSDVLDVFGSDLKLTE